MNIIDILDAIKAKLEDYFTTNNIEAVISVLPDDVDVADEEKLYVYLDIDNRKFFKFTTDTYTVQYDVKIGLAKISVNYAEFVSEISPIEAGIAELLMRQMMVTQVSVDEYAYDLTNATGFCAIIATVGVSP